MTRDITDTLEIVALLLAGIASGTFLLQRFLVWWRPPKRVLVLPANQDAATARVIDGWVTIVGLAACPTDRFLVEDAKPPLPYTGQVLLTVKVRDSEEPAREIHLGAWKGGFVSGVQFPDRLGHLVLGPEHEVHLTPEGTTLIGRIV